jgi:cyclase
MTLLPRLIPVLLLKDECFVKTLNFKKYNYIGDPCNTVRIFNELEVDEILILTISKNRFEHDLNWKIMKDISTECFIPLGYGGGITSLDQAKKILDIGYEKVVINTSAFNNPKLIEDIANYSGSQSVVVSIDTKKNILGQVKIFNKSVKHFVHHEIVVWAEKFESLGAGEILLTSIDKEGTWKGMDLEIVKSISSKISIPIIAHGGAGNLVHVSEAFKNGASAVGVGSLVVYQKEKMGVLVNFPDKTSLMNIKNCVINGK